MLFAAVGLVVSSSFTAPGMEMMGLFGRRSSSRIAVSEEPFAESTRSRSRVTSR